MGFTPLEPVSKPKGGGGFTPFASDGSAAVRELFPGAIVTSGHRTNNVGFATDDHHFSHGAVDVAPIKGMTFDQFTKKLKEAGYPIIQALDEQAHPSKYATGPHWHVALGERKSGFVPAKPVEQPRGFTPHADTRGGPQSAPRPGNRPSRPILKQDTETTGGDIIEGIENIPSSAWNTVKGIGHAVAHPIETGKAVLDTAGGAMTEGMEALGIPGTTPRGKAAEKTFDAAIEPLKHPIRSFAKDPVGTALTVLPAGGAALKATKLGIKGADAAHLAMLGPAERAAIRAQRVEDAAHASRYGALQRQIVGRHSLDRDRAIARLQSHQKVVGNASVEDQRAIVAAIEGGKRSIAKLPEQYRRSAMELRNVAQQYRLKIEDVLKKDDGTGPNFVDNYYAHLWKQDAKAKAFFSGKQGSGRNLKARKFPTLEEGLKAGLTPIHENPLDTMSAYVDSMSKYLQAHDLTRSMKSAGMAKWAFEGKVPEGYHKLDGIGTTKKATIANRETDPSIIPGRVLVAPRAAAVKYNRFVDPGVESNLRAKGKTGLATAFNAAKRATNATSSLALTFSGFHPTLVAGKAVASDLGNAITHTFRGEPIKALKSIAHAPIAPIRPVIDKLAGKMSMKGRLLSGDQAMTQIDRLWRDAGGRLKNDSGYRASLKPNLWQSFKRGTFKRDVLDMSKMPKGSSGYEKLGKIADNVGRVMDTMTSGIFDHFVPAMKRQAFEREMAANLKPGMTDAEQRQLARRVMDNVSGRMGELERDNIFWPQSFSDIMRLVVLSPSWQYGDWKVLNDAAGKNATGHGVAQAVALAGSYYMMNGIANYLHTGQRPQGQDWVAYRTGGTTEDHSGVHPERATFPSIMKDVFNVGADPVGEVSNKMAPLPRGLIEVARNSDWRDNPVFRPTALGKDDLPPDAPKSMKQNRAVAAGEHVAGSFSPFSMQDNPNGPNSGIGPVGHFLFGERPAGERFYDPEGYAQLQKYLALKRVKSAAHAEQKDKEKKAKRP